VNRLEWMSSALCVNCDDRILHKTAFGFDVSIWEQLLPPLVGATTVIAPSSARGDARSLLHLIESERATIVHFVPTLLEAFVEAVPPGACPNLRAIVCSGEALPKAVALKCTRRLIAAIYNYYGPTEAAIDVTAWRFDPTESFEFVPIGRAIQNVRVHVLAPDLSRVPIGSIGELFVGGVAVGAGYVNRPLLT